MIRIFTTIRFWFQDRTTTCQSGNQGVCRQSPHSPRRPSNLRNVDPSRSAARIGGAAAGRKMGACISRSLRLKMSHARVPGNYLRLPAPVQHTAGGREIVGGFAAACEVVMTDVYSPSEPAPHALDLRRLVLVGIALPAVV